MEKNPETRNEETRQYRREETQRTENIDTLLRRLEHQLLTRWLVTIVGLLVAGIGISYSLARTNHVANQANRIALSVAQERKTAILQSCQAQNLRNTTTITFFNNYVTQFEHTHKLSAGQKAQLQGQVKANETLINDLAPYQNCNKLVQRATSTP